MAEDFQSSRDWWKISTNSSSGGAASYDGGSPATSNLSCSTTITDVTAAPFAWTAFGPSIDWNQTLLSNSGRAETGFQAMLQEDLHSKSDFSVPIQLKDMNHHHHHHHHHPFFFENSSIISSSGFPLVSSSSSSSSSSIMQGLLEPDSRVEQSLFDGQHMFHYEQSQFMQQKQQSSVNQLQFSNSTPFWNASTSSLPFDLPIKSFEGDGEKKSSSEPPMKKIRAESSAALPTFKVRKEKLGDRITALQQLVSPFGKTDTASVLHEAIEYIKFLHEQVNVLSTPYLKSGHPLQQQHQGSEKLKDDDWQKEDLRSRGLCLVPIASTYPVATETTADLWTPTFGGNYR